MVEVRAELAGVHVRDAMVTRFHAVPEDAPLAVVVDELLTGEQQDFPVLADAQIVGLLSRSQLMEAISSGRRNTRVGEIMQTDIQNVEQEELLQDVWQRMQEKKWKTLPVTHDGSLVGMLTLENVGEWLMIQAAERAGASNRGTRNMFDQT